MFIAFLLSVAAADEPVAVTPPPVVENGIKDAGQASLFSTDDYPDSARRLGQEGLVEVHLEVTPEGRVGGCRVLFSSASPVLEERTCEILQKRARFKPALDQNGRPVADTYRQKVRWELPKQPLIATLDRVILSYDPKGKLSSCRYESSDSETSQPTCAQMDELAQLIWKNSDRTGRLAGRTLILEHRLQPGIDVAIERPSDPDSTLHWFQRAQFELAPSGKVARCSVVENEGQTDGPSICDVPPDGPFERSSRFERRFYQATVALISLPPS